MAPCQFAELLKRKKLETMRSEWGFGLIASTLMNVHTRRKRSDKLSYPSDFMPSLMGNKQEDSGKSVIQMMATARAVTENLGGKVVTNSS